MTKENQKRDIGFLGRAWLERVKNIRSMAKERLKINLKYSPEAHLLDNATKAPLDSELFTGPIHEELSAQEIFSGDEDLYKSLEDAQVAGTPQSFDAGAMPTAPTRHKRFTSVQKALVAAILLIATMLVYVLTRSPSPSVVRLPPESADRMAPAANQTPTLEPLAPESTGTAARNTPEPDSTLEPQEPLSLKVAQTLYLNGDYDQAAIVYEKLHKTLPPGPKEDLMRDFLQFQTALCMERTADYTQAARLLRKVLKSNSPAVRVLADYHSSLLEMQNKQYLNARIKAYQAIALIDAIDIDRDWAVSLKRDCYFLAAEVMTRKVLSLCDADKDLPEDLWGNLRSANEPFARLDETQLRTFLESGSQRLSLAVLGPQIQQSSRQGGLSRYDVTCNGTPVEELLIRFAANADVDMYWNLAGDEVGIRKRLVYLYLPSATTRQFATAAAGSAGLLARMDEKGVLNIFNPARYSYVSEHISFLAEEAVSLWQHFLLGFPSDQRLANVHFALALLHAQEGRPTESIAEYKLLANRFSRSSLAPFALLNSARLKTSMRNYPGGRMDFKQLVEQYPDTEIAGKACLYLADATAKTGLTTEAARLYRKAYYLNFSPESQSAAALGAGKCAYHMKDFESAAKWLTKYIGLARDRKAKDFYSACLLFGKTWLALGNSEAACNALQYALEGGPTRLAKEEYMETISALAEAYMQQGHFIQAFDMLENIHSAGLSRKESVEILLLKSKTLRAIGLVDKAIVILGGRGEYLSDPQLKAKICFGLSECYIEKGDFNLARKNLAEILVLTEYGPLAQQSALKLADVCLRLGQDSQTISVCSQLLDLPPSEQIKQGALELLAKAYNQQKNYDGAALALLGQWK